VGAQQQRILADLGEAIIGTQKSLEVSGSRSEEQLQHMHAELAGVSEKANAAVAQVIERLAGAGARISTETVAAEQQLSSAEEFCVLPLMNLRDVSALPKPVWLSPCGNGGDG
jgi:hypothetical protein